MRRRVRLNILFLVPWAFGVLATQLCVPDAHAIETYEEMALIREWTLVRKVLLSSEFSSETEKARRGVTRWTKSPVYYAATTQPHLKKLVSSAVASVNSVLAETGIKIELTFEPTDRPDGVMAFIPKKEFARALKKVKCSPPEINVAAVLCARTDFDTDEMLLSVIVIDASLEGVGLEDSILEDIYQSMGLLNDQDLFPDSVIFENFYGSTHRTKLSSLDRKLLFFLYKYLKPGDGEEIVREKFDRHWKDIHVD